MSTSTIRGLASIVISCWNQFEFTRRCTAALRQHTREPWDLVVVDNGSTDDTAVYLAVVQDGAAVPVTVVTNATNRGYPAAINQSLQVARGQYLVLLNNDVVVTDGWLDQMIALATATNGSSASEAPCPVAPGPPPWPPLHKRGKGYVRRVGVLLLTSSGETSRSLILPRTASQGGRKAATGPQDPLNLHLQRSRRRREL
jgi:glycosyltransferase involved in cell wall biosynthesis